MRYRKPFTTEQRREATREYQLFRSNVRELRKAYPPLTKAQMNIFARYENRVMAIGLELLKVDARVNAAVLNAQIELARQAMAEYFELKYFGE